MQKLNSLRSLGLAALVLSIVVPQSASAASVDAVKVTETAIAAFRDVCLKTAPSFEKGIVAAKRYGAKKMDISDGTGWIGATANESLSIQIKPNKECATTSKNKSDPSLQKQFTKVVTDVTDSAPAEANGLAFFGTIHGHRYLFLHDRRGGEAYVMENPAK
jgi:hypothetical protein